MSFHLGCAIWAYKDWVGNLFPSGSRSADFLRLYSQRFTAVEGNTTFYSIPNRATIERWVADTPAGFEFCLKLPRDLTHQGLLTPAIAATADFLAQMQPLGDRLGVLFAQLPPSYGPAHVEDLLQFLTAFPRDRAEIALEVRHPDWFREPHASRLNTALSDLGVGRVILDSRPLYDSDDDPQLHSERRKPKLPLHLSVTAPFTLVRYISHPDRSFNTPYLQTWAAQVAQWLHQGTRIYFFVHCPVERQSPDNARYFQTLLEQHPAPVPPLPWNRLEPPPVQLSLF